MQMITFNLIGLGDEQGLQYRLLPMAEFINIRKSDHSKNDTSRCEGVLMAFCGAADFESMPEKENEIVVLHAGYLHSMGKVQGMKTLRVWRPDDWIIQP